MEKSAYICLNVNWKCALILTAQARSCVVEAANIRQVEHRTIGLLCKHRMMDLQSKNLERGSLLGVWQEIRSGKHTDMDGWLITSAEYLSAHLSIY